jgi:hypothetical protein
MTPDLILVTADAGSHPQTSQVSLETLCSTQCTEETVADGTLCPALPTEERVDDRAFLTSMDWLDSLPITEATRIRRHTDVSQDRRYVVQSSSTSYYDAEYTAAPTRIPPWALLVEETQAFFEGGHGTSPDLIYAREVPDTPDSGKTNFDKRHAPSS